MCKNYLHQQQPATSVKIPSRNDMKCYSTSGNACLKSHSDIPRLRVVFACLVRESLGPNHHQRRRMFTATSSATKLPTSELARGLLLCCESTRVVRCVIS